MEFPRHGFDASASLLAELGRRAHGTERDRLLGRILGSIGAGSDVEHPFLCSDGTRISIGQNVWVGPGCHFYDTAPIVIEDGARIGAGVRILASHFARSLADPDEEGSLIHIGRGVRVGGASVIGPGVRIGPHAVIGVGSVVTADVGPGLFVSGNPARTHTF